MLTHEEIRQIWEDTSRIKNKVQTELDVTRNPQPELVSLNDALVEVKYRTIKLARANGLKLF